MKIWKPIKVWPAVWVWLRLLLGVGATGGWAQVPPGLPWPLRVPVPELLWVDAQAAVDSTQRLLAVASAPGLNRLSPPTCDGLHAQLGAVPPWDTLWPAALYWRAALWQAQDSLPQALAAWRTLADRPGPLELVASLALLDVWLDQKAYDTAASWAEAKRKALPYSWGLAYQHGLALQGLGRWAASAEAFEAAAALHPACAECHLGYGLALWQQGWTLPAWLAWALAHGLAPTDAPGLQAAAWAAELLEFRAAEPAPDPKAAPSFVGLDWEEAFRQGHLDPEPKAWATRNPESLPAQPLVRALVGLAQSWADDPDQPSLYLRYPAWLLATGHLPAAAQHLLYTATANKTSQKWMQKNAAATAAWRAALRDTLAPEYGRLTFAGQVLRPQSEPDGTLRYAEPPEATDAWGQAAPPAGWSLTFHPNTRVELASKTNSHGRAHGPQWTLGPDGLPILVLEYADGQPQRSIRWNRTGAGPWLTIEDSQGNRVGYYPSPEAGCIGPVCLGLRLQDGLPDGPETEYWADDLVRTSGLWPTPARKFNWEMGIFTGPLELNWPNGLPRERALAQAGEYQGTRLLYDEAGTLRDSAQYQQGRLAGEQRLFYADGRLRAVFSWHLGVPHGLQRTFHPNGQVATEAAWHYGRRSGGMRTWSADGHLMEDWHYEADRALGYTLLSPEGALLGQGHNPDGNFFFRRKNEAGTVLEEGHFALGLRFGEWKTYYLHGQQYEELEYREDALWGPAVRYWPDGQLQQQCHYWQGLRQGLCTDYHPNGKPARQGHFRADSAWGWHAAWDADGKLTQLAYYQADALRGWELELLDGQLTEARFHTPQGIAWVLRPRADGPAWDTLRLLPSAWDAPEVFDIDQLPQLASCYNPTVRKQPWAHGQPALQGQYLAGQPTGRWTRHHHDGSLAFEWQYRGGLLQDTLRVLWPNGRTARTEVYSNGVRHGAFAQYDMLGQPTTLGQYTAGEPSGTWREFEDGQLWEKAQYQNGQRDGETRLYLPGDSTQALVEILYREGGVVGLRHPSAKGWKTVTLPAAGGRLLGYHADGTLAFRAQVVAGAWHGKLEAYWPNGKLARSEEWHHGQRHGQLEVRNAAGVKLLEAQYRYGQLHGQARYFTADGKPARAESWHDGLPHGNWVRLHPPTGKTLTAWKMQHGLATEIRTSGLE